MYDRADAPAGKLAGRSRRSVLFVPGSNERAIDKARSTNADCIVFDLEDMVPDDQKPSARARLVAWSAGRDFWPSERIARVNGIDTPWGREDIEALASANIDAMLVPKVQSADDLAAYLDVMDAHGGAGLDLWMLAETPRAIIDLDRIVESTPRLKVIVMGTQDLIKALRIRPDPQRIGLVSLLAHSVVIARAHGLTIVDGVFVAVNDDEGFKVICDQGAALGFDGKALIHPGQVAIANSVFS
jgi:citrate lyase subunit beta / citryl-CoA lyase